MISHNTFLQNFLQDFFNCQIIRGSFTLRFRNTLLPLISHRNFSRQSLFRSADPVKRWWAYLDLNQGPRPYQGRALTS